MRGCSVSVVKGTERWAGLGEAVLSNNHSSQMAGGDIPVRGIIPGRDDCRAQRNAAGAEDSSTIYKRLGVCGKEGAKLEKSLSLKGPSSC